MECKSAMLSQPVVKQCSSCGGKSHVRIVLTVLLSNQFNKKKWLSRRRRRMQRASEQSPDGAPVISHVQHNISIAVMPDAFIP